MNNPEPQRPYIGVHLLLIKDNTVLLMKRSVKDEMDGLYALVAGKVDHHESPTVALCREAYEEVGIQIKPADLEHVLTVHHANTDYKAQKLDVIEFYFVPRNWEGEPTIKEPEKATELEFFPLDNLPQPLPKVLLFALDAVNSGIRFVEN